MRFKAIPKKPKRWQLWKIKKYREEKKCSNIAEELLMWHFNKIEKRGKKEK